MAAILSRPGRVRQLLLGVAVAAACATAGAVAAPALATNEYFPSCYPCISSSDNAPENWITNVQAINHSGGGICATVWKNNGGGNYQEMAYECGSGGETATACSYSAEFVGHGYIKTETSAGYLRGRQDNYKSCG
ncbi:MAG: hypothetical protein ABSG93_19715 [Solirubrobacteraceae bacterium]|jgi:hypothetical protein